MLNEFPFEISHLALHDDIKYFATYNMVCRNFVVPLMISRRRRRRSRSRTSPRRSRKNPRRLQFRCCLRRDELRGNGTEEIGWTLLDILKVTSFITADFRENSGEKER